MVKVFSPHFHDMKGTIAYKKGRLGKIHFQRNRGNIAMHLCMKRERRPSEAQCQQREIFAQAATTFRNLSREQRENLRAWGALRDDLISGYAWWTKAQLSDIRISPLIDRDECHAIPFQNRNLQEGKEGFDHFTVSEEGDGYVRVAWGIDDPTLPWEREYFSYGSSGHDMTLLDNDTVLAVGNDGIVVVRKNGQWQSVNSLTSEHLYRCRAASATVAWAAGESGTVVKYHNGTCELHSLDPPETIYALHAFDEDTVAVGADVNTVGIYENGAWVVHENLPITVPMAIWGPAINDFWVADYMGKFLHWNGSEFDQEISTGTENNVMDMHGTAADDIYAVTWNGRVYHYDGEQWSIFATLTQYLNRIVALSDGTLSVMKRSGQIYRYDGAWVLYGDVQPDITYNGFAVNAYGDAFIVGENFFLKHARFNRHAELYGGTGDASGATLAMTHWYQIAIAQGAAITYGCTMKRGHAGAPLPKLVLVMQGTDGTEYVDAWIPTAGGDAWETHEREIPAPAPLKGIKMYAEAQKRGEEPDHAYIDDFQAYAEGRFVVVKCEHPILDRVVVTNEDGSVVWYDSGEGA
ncbi:MAG: hypothetical protein DRN07_08285 [Thermoplasmata archaeon]|nr:MAG: hypothetical protein DRN07_08285 [Thermoplasmata archaeon]